MQAADDVKLGGAFAYTLRGALINFFESKGVCAGSVGVAAKSAQLTVRHADIGRIDVPIDVVIGDVAVAFLADVICKPSDREEVGRAIKGNTVFGVQAHAGENSLRDGL